MAVLLLVVLVVGVAWAVAFSVTEKNRMDHEFKMARLKSKKRCFECNQEADTEFLIGSGGLCGDCLASYGFMGKVDGNESVRDDEI